jgi:SAM-dependent methyltransferase
VAELYDRAVVPFWSVPFGRMLLSVFQRRPRQPGWQVVDVACGTGYPALELALLLGPDGDVAGLDIWGAGIDRARARAEAMRLNNVVFLVADVANCDLPEQTFDVAVCNLGLTNFTCPDAALKGMARLLQPDGTLLLTTNLYGTMQEFFETYRGVLNDLGLLDLSWEVEGLMHQQPTIERVEALLDMAGFTVDQALTDHVALRFSDGSTFLHSPLVGLNFLPGWRAPVSDTSLRRVVFNEIERRLNAQAAVTGRLDLKVPMLCVTARRRA